MDKQEYGDEYKEHLLEQYKVIAESVNAIGARRVDFNKFYLSLLSGLLAIVSLIVDKGLFNQALSFIFLLIAILGICLCLLWQFSIRSFERISKARYIVLGEIEEQLPFSAFKKSGEYQHEEGKHYAIARVTRYVSYLMLLPYILLLIYATYGIVK